MAESPLLLRARTVQSGEVVAVSPDSADWHYVHFRVLRLPAGEQNAATTGELEVAIVVIAGTVNVASSAGEWQAIGSRTDPFSGQPAAVYLPSGTRYAIQAVGPAEVAICGAKARGTIPARLIQPEPEYIRGTGHAQRVIRNILMGADAATALFVTEVVTPPGNWSSYPPHKHDVDDPPNESQLEEIYYYRARPEAGFAFQRIYSGDGDLDETITVHDRDAVLVPRGYHVCAAAAEYWIYYLNVLAGPKHVYHMSFDPAHAWIKEQWTW
jgi:5-deoxy-glucuronate isomerase